MDRGLGARTLGRTEMEVTRLGYGETAIIEVTEVVADAILNAVLDAGINFIDTAVDYGRSEEFIGRFISSRRSEYYLATKCGCTAPRAAGRAHVYTRDNIVSGVEQSLARMRTDYLDLAQLHSSLSREPLSGTEAIETLRDLQTEGKVRSIGSSSTLPNIVEQIDMGVFGEFQIPYSALRREHEEVITRSAKGGAGTVIRGGVAQGPPETSREVEETWAIFKESKLGELCEEGESHSAFLLRFTLAHPDIHTVIAGTKSADHLQENVNAARRGPMPPDTYAEAKRHLDAIAY